MPIAVITADNFRLEDGETNNGWGSLGGGPSPSSEGSFYYQGGNLVNKKITGTGGVTYDPTSDGQAGVDFTAPTTRHWLAKVIVTDYGGLDATSGSRLRIGSGTNAFHQVNLAGSAAAIDRLKTYPQKGGFIVMAVSPNVPGFRELTVGNPILTAVDYFGFEANFASSQAKSENVGMDAIDIGTGLTLVGGGAGSPAGNWRSFFETDEGVIANRWGYAQSIDNSIAQLTGAMRIGDGSTQTEFSGSGSVIWVDGLFEPGFSSPVVDLTLSGVTFKDVATHTSLGSASISDTRADFTYVGTTRLANVSHTLGNFRNYNMTSSVTVDDGTISVARINQNLGSIVNSVINCVSLANEAVIIDPTFANLIGNTWNQRGLGHAIEITAPGSYSVVGQTFAGFGADETANSAIHNNSGGLVTINVTSGSTPTVTNGAGASTVVNNQISLTLTGVQPGSDIVILNAGTEIVRADVDANAGTTYAYSYQILGNVDIAVYRSGYVPFVIRDYPLSLSNGSVPIGQRLDRAFLN